MEKWPSRQAVICYKKKGEIRMRISPIVYSADPTAAGAAGVKTAIHAFAADDGDDSRYRRIGDADAAV